MKNNKMFNLANKEMPIKTTMRHLQCFDKDKSKQGKQ